MASKEMLELRNRFFTAAPPLPRQTVTMGDFSLDVIGLSFGARAALMKSCMAEPKQNEEGEDSGGQMDLEKLQPTLVISCVVFPGTTERVFSEADRDAICELPSEYVDELMSVAAKLSGLNKDAKKEAEGNSGATAG